MGTAASLLRCGISCTKVNFAEPPFNSISCLLDLRDGARMASQLEGNKYRDHARRSGDFSDSAMAQTLLLTSPYRFNATRRVESVAAAFVPGVDQDDVLGLLVHQPDHWVAIRQDRSQGSTAAWLLDSVQKRPRPLTTAAFSRHLAQFPLTYQVYTEQG